MFSASSPTTSLAPRRKFLTAAGSVACCGHSRPQRFLDVGDRSPRIKIPRRKTCSNSEADSPTRNRGVDSPRQLRCLSPRIRAPQINPSFWHNNITPSPDLGSPSQTAILRNPVSSAFVPSNRPPSSGRVPASGFIPRPNAFCHRHRRPIRGEIEGRWSAKRQKIRSASSVRIREEDRAGVMTQSSAGWRTGRFYGDRNPLYGGLEDIHHRPTEVAQELPTSPANTKLYVSALSKPEDDVRTT